ncbi:MULTISPECIES: DUF3280 domain-containing protein [unclassified Aureimonas]|uniref:DUF3280 domain-containing protein n=1 Tax=unclassified Aureimonas TaxID=2615206 RepID=UPI0006F9F03F|nr:MULTISPECIES: DUF3280 domain-containing protein [unclassified Aureimonas]KQT70005.1 hypothetical protein ASG62_02625 [Aureimonas sp. Leaf427]KQT75840.1 hypothetical protein ASG54_13590 [Aureimonas sp. Leaf460]
MRVQGGTIPVLCAVLFAWPVAAAEKTVAVFDFELIDTSLEGELNGVDPRQTQRLTLLAPKLRADIDAEPELGLVDTGPVAARAKEQALLKCERCAIDLGRDLGADIVVTGTVQKVSNLILNINAYGHEVATGKLVAQGSADIRGNNDEMWVRGVAALWRNTLKKQFQAVEAAP